MKRKIKYISTLVMLLMVALASSCLKKGLEDYPLFDTNEITLVGAEYRFNGTVIKNGQPVVAYQPLTVTQTIDKPTSTINVVITVPAANGQFTTAEKAKVVQTNLWFFMNISTAATISPTGGTPALGFPTDATKPLKYTVTAANGASRVWTINVTSFINQ
ncbi:DUF5018-related domain-containing protein [Pedobacter nyackensis]|uniref:DUF5018 domain-containing protein n=1 Tax=Pedobacter nyackensis TaxID=475255 RepID=A0A1W2DKI8_9SPHI|nr:hypothetical protein [Pedobacter nyackensis]SMC97913.1 hypothetical protein SAMN04488101_107123 [Pedobacter nyackensis]